ncbi:hypothetical protein SLE2022_325560 [Rubroshorea leprosula]
MGYLSCNAESAIAVCDPYNWDRRRKGKRTRPPRIPNFKIREFLYTELLDATNAFSAETFLGKGSHGSVYKATLDNGKLVAAVKKTTSGNFKHSGSKCINCNCNSPGDNEIEILSRVQNPGFVNLLGFCSDSRSSKLIVVEFMPNGSLYDLLHSSSTSRPPGWSRRVRFALQIAKAVQALHSANPPVIHRDIKSSNILIDDEWNARLGDFGLALRGHVEDVRIKCTPPAGTLGYLDPGYLAPSDVSSKSDVFSYGILLLEIISGRHAIDLNYSPPSVVDWAVPLIKRGNFTAICDNRIGSPADPEVIRTLALLAARCVRSTAEKRPGMSEIIECLKVVRKRVHAPPVWSNLRRRVRRVDKPTPTFVQYPVFDGSEEVFRSSRCGSRRNSRKVSSVASVEHEGGITGERVVRSKSIGSFSEVTMNVGLESDLDGDHVALVIRKKPAGAAVVRLSKSRSTGVLQGRRLLNHSSKGYVLEKEKAKRTLSTTQLDFSKLIISGDEKFERKMLEKPLVSF